MTKRQTEAGLVNKPVSSVGAPTLLTGLFTSPASVCLLVIGHSCDSAEKSTVQAAGDLDLQGGLSSSPVLLDAALVEQVNGTIGGQGTEDYTRSFGKGERLAPRLA